MTRYTDAEHTITLTDAEDNIIDLSGCSDFYLTYAQDGVTELTKTGADVTLQEDGTLLVALTQEETGRFERGKVDVQLRFKDEYIPHYYRDSSGRITVNPMWSKDVSIEYRRGVSSNTVTVPDGKF